MSRGTTARRIASAASALIAAIALAVPLALAAAPERAEALSGADFDPEYIIDDGLFYDAYAMSAAEIQQFLDSKIGQCRNGQCMNVFSMYYGGRGRDVSANGALICEAIPAGNYTVATLIYTAQVACGISAKVVLVTMQKEQSLVTSKEPSLWALSHAMGYACPDTAPCDPSAAGVANQIVLGTRVLKAYNHAQGSRPGTTFGRAPGPQWIGYNPNSACGGTTLNIRNLATAALYTYTPYQPNAAALANLHGTGDGCSTYGNRNFWVYYNQWFGAPTNPAPERIAAAHAAAGGDAGWLGPAKSGYVCGLVRGGCYREFTNAAVYASYRTQGNPISGAQRTLWNQLRAQDGVLGYPTTGRIDGLIRGGSYQVFESGAIFTHPGGTVPIWGAIKSKWFDMGSEWGAAGYPTSAEKGVTGGVVQDFEGGRIFWSAASGARWVPGEAAEATRQFSWLGVPTGDQSCTLERNGCVQHFTGGSLYTSEGGSWPVRGGVKSAWTAMGAERGKAGYPLSAEIGVTGGVYQQFEDGRIYWTAANGARFVPTASVTAMASFPWLGLPSSDHLCGLVKGGCYQVFAGGVLYTSDGGVWPVRGGVKSAWAALGAEWGKAGYPLSAEIGITGGVYQQFENGRIYWSASTGARFVPTASVTALASFPWLGFPTSDHLCGLVNGGCYQVFSGGVLYTSSGGVWPVRGGIKDAWAKMGAEWGKAGYPLSAEIGITGGVYQQFQNGRMYWSATEGTRYVPNA